MTYLNFIFLFLHVLFFILEADIILFTPLHLSDSFSFFSDYSIFSPSCPVKTICLQMCWCWIFLINWVFLKLNRPFKEHMTGKCIVTVLKTELFCSEMHGSLKAAMVQTWWSYRIWYISVDSTSQQDIKLKWAQP